ncbi:MAG: toprim domain-containing protein [Aquificaceae bacterium]|nr:toprim domain-containing protein [Aquificaceae bacterium]
MLKSWIERLCEASRENAVLVEGKRDRERLQKYGIKNIFTLEGKRFSDLPDILEGFQRVILLIDLDKNGEKINKKVKEILEKQGYILIEDFREELRKIGITFVEELNGEVGHTKCAPCSGQAHKV